MALTSRTSSRIQDDILSEIEGGSSDAFRRRLTVVPNVSLLEEQSVEAAAKQIEGEKALRLLVCLAGELHPEKSLAQVDMAKALHTFQLNTLGHLMFYKHFVPLIPTSREFAKIKEQWITPGGNDPARGLVGESNGVCLSLSARVGSIGDNGKGGCSKAALNQVVRTLDHELSSGKNQLEVNSRMLVDLFSPLSHRPCHIVSTNPVGEGCPEMTKLLAAVDPGTTITSFTRPIIGAKTPDPANGVFSPDQAIEKMTGLLRKARRSENAEHSYGGRFYDWKAEPVPW
ncbi:hypothetical protein QFC21_000396 [Naganishia friedmannii]|uniref:Uncharacterized protein n=1 Tax=Naganishia friedmannii TaxID=89922 RepID=A0ACC2WCW8_9TREE|nr:hypothetical protein QFC21_000396 [Naganishia friedmannii]